MSNHRDSENDTKDALATGCPNGPSSACQALKDFQQTDTTFRIIHDNIVDGIVSIDEAGIVLSCNPAIKKIFGYTAEELIGCNISVLVPEPHRTHHDEYLRRYNETCEDDIIGKSRDLTGCRKDGSCVPIRLAVSAATINGQRVFTGILRDISQRKRAEKALHRAKKLAEKSSLAKSSFLANMSHELRTPLNAIIGFTQMLQITPFAKEETHKEYQGIVLSSAEHLLGLINEILDLAKIESGKLTLFTEDFSPQPIIHECIQLSLGMAAEHTISFIDETVNQDLPQITADQGRFKQILINLISNAIKYNSEGGVIVLECRKTKEGMARFYVRDTGDGIAKGVGEQVFETFNRLDAETSAIEGTGIGLALCKQLSEKMGGSIGYSSKPGTGSSFWFEMPISQPKASRASRASGPRNPRPTLHLSKHFSSFSSSAHVSPGVSGTSERVPIKPTPH